MKTRLGLAALFFLAACATPVPQRTDPLAGLGVTAAGAGTFRTLELGLVLSENTHGAIEYARKAGRFESYAAQQYPVERILEGFVQDLQGEFRRVTKLNKVSDGAGVADVVAVVDVYVKYPGSIFTGAHLAVKTIIMRPDGTLIDTPKGESERHPRQERGIGPTKISKAMDWVIKETRGQWRASLVGSSALRTLAAGGKAAPVAAAPAAPVFRSVVDEPDYKLPEDPSLFALVVGVEEYSGAPKAAFAERDAEAVRKHLLALGYPERNVIVLKGQQALRSGLEKYLESWLPRNLKPESKLFVYFSGHGAPDPVTGEAYLMPWDGDPKFLDTTAYPLRRLYAKLDALPAKKVSVALDACFSGAGGRSVLPAGARPLVAKSTLGAGVPARLGVLAAAAGDEITGAADGEGHGLFTFHLLKALSESRGRATLKSLHQALTPRVQDAARRDNREQSPQALGRLDLSLR